MSQFKVMNGTIYMGTMAIPGHGCNSVEEMQHYCDTMNGSIDPEDAERAKLNDEKIAKLSKESRQKIIDLLNLP